MKQILFFFTFIAFSFSFNSCFLYPCVDGVTFPEAIVNFDLKGDTISLNDTIELHIQYPRFFSTENASFDIDQDFQMGILSDLFLIIDSNNLLENYILFNMGFDIRIIKGQESPFSDIIILDMDEDYYYLTLKLNPKQTGFYAIDPRVILLDKKGRWLPHKEQGEDVTPLSETKCKQNVGDDPEYINIDKNTGELMNTFDLYYNSEFYYFAGSQDECPYECQKDRFFSRFVFFYVEQ